MSLSESESIAVLEERVRRFILNWLSMFNRIRLIVSFCMFSLTNLYAVGTLILITKLSQRAISCLNGIHRRPEKVSVRAYPSPKLTI